MYDKILNSEAYYEEQRRKLIEIAIWFFIFIISFLYVLVDFLATSNSFVEYLQGNLTKAIIPAVIFFTPLIFSLIFGTMPIEAVRNNIRKTIEVMGSLFSVVVSSLPDEDEQVKQVNVDKLLKNELTFQQLSESSRKLADAIYRRAGVYLLVGVIIAFLGLWFFYSQGLPSLHAANLEASILALAPKMGILLFVEFVAFFFLRQYKSAMDEFRYYEEVARKREEVAYLLESKNNFLSTQENLLSDLIKTNTYFSKNSVLGAGESTELLEVKKLDKGEIEFLDFAYKFFNKRSS